MIDDHSPRELVQMGQFLLIVIAPDSYQAMIFQSESL